MPSDHTGNGQAAGIIPDGGATADESPVVRVPVDGDAITAVSVTQPIKTLANWLDWQMHPRAASGAVDQSILRYRNARGHTRFHVDHLGFPSGRLSHWDGRLDLADWPFTPTGSEPVAAGPGWRAQLSEGTVHTEHPNPDMPAPHITLGSAIGTINAHAFALSGPLTWTGPKVSWSLEWDAMFYGSIPTAPTRGFYMGLWLDVGIGYSNPRGLPTAGASTQHVLFLKDTSHANLKLQTKDEAGSATTTTGVSVDSIRNTWARFKLQFMGADVADNSATRLDAYINGTNVATHTGNMAYPAGYTTYYDDPVGGLAVGFSVVTLALGGEYGLRIANPRLTTAVFAADVI
jgi:hypothetical protein